MQFKETMTIDNLKKLILTKVNWWGKLQVKHSSDLKFRLGSIDFNKMKPCLLILEKPSNSGFIETKNLIAVIYLNTLLKGF
jgi:hypothetical protein